MEIYQPNTNKPDKIIVHHTAVPGNTPQFNEVNEYHKQQYTCLSSLGFFVAYHYFIEKDGTTLQARSDTDAGCHTIGQNQSSIGICLAGNFDIEYPTAAQRNALVVLLNTETGKWNINRQSIFPHRAFAPKSCYGYRLSNTWASQQLDSYVTNSIMNTLWFLLETLQKKFTILSNGHN